MEIKEIIKIGKEWRGVAPTDIVKLAGAGSARQYFRMLWDKESVIATVGPDVAENRAFCQLANAFGNRARRCGSFAVPEIYHISPDYRIYLQQDFGNGSLLDQLLLLKGDPSGDNSIEELIKRVFDGLIDLQLTSAEEWKDYLITSSFGKTRVISDLQYFKNCFLRPSGVTFNEDVLDHEITLFAESACDYDHALNGFMYRDFQSRNIILTEVSIESAPLPGFIDFQGGMKGPLVYDAVSFLWQAKARLTNEMRCRMLDYYVTKLSAEIGISPDALKRTAEKMIVLRNLQVLGAYGFRGLVERKAHFLESIPPALDNLRDKLDTSALKEYPELERCCRLLVESDRFKSRKHEGLTVEVYSFSYKKGYPENLTGNGGGFVFDCRGMHNPGRYDEFKPLTGRDKAVIDFLEERGEVQRFVKNASGMVLPAVECYLRRGFNDLQVAFGCTGGRHRSVYCAEAIAKLITEKYPEATVHLIHREQGIEEEFPGISK